MRTPIKIFSVIASAAFVYAAFCAIAAGQAVAIKPPTAADWAAVAKLPDFSGVWERGGGGGGGGGAPRGAAPAPAAATPATGAAAPRGAGAAPRGAAAAGARGGGMSLTPEYEAKRRAYQANPPQDNQTANCLPPGMPGIMTQPYPMEFLLTPGKVTIVIEAYTQVRHIYTDGRKLPEDPDPKFFGTSVGRWDGDTLVVDSVGFSPITQLAAGVPHSDKMKILERFRLTDPDTMSIETTITDPEALTAPYTTSSSLRRHRNWTITEYICEENNRNGVDETGKSTINTNPNGSNAPTKD
jgi:hypothetical protein